MSWQLLMIWLLTSLLLLTTLLLLTSFPLPWHPSVFLVVGVPVDVLLAPPLFARVAATAGVLLYRASPLWLLSLLLLASISAYVPAHANVLAFLGNLLMQAVALADTVCPCFGFYCPSFDCCWHCCIAFAGRGKPVAVDVHVIPGYMDSHGYHGYHVATMATRLLLYL
jgi:hypothetical protein